MRLHLIEEYFYVKIVATAYGRSTVNSAYHTENRFSPAAVWCWQATTNSTIGAALRRLQAALQHHHLHWGWYDLVPTEMVNTVVKLCPELTPEDLGTDPQAYQGRLKA